MRHIEVMHGGLFPGDEQGALGVLYGAEGSGDRVTIVVEPYCVRLLLDGIARGHDLGCMEVPSSVSLAMAAQGWDDDWDDDERDDLRHMHWLYRRVSGYWVLLGRVVALLQVRDR